MRPARAALNQVVPRQTARGILASHQDREEDEEGGRAWVWVWDWASPAGGRRRDSSIEVMARDARAKDPTKGRGHE